MTNYLIGLVFLLFGGYKIHLQDFLESALYFCVGIGFLLMGASKDSKFERYKKQINIVSWVFVMLGLLLFIAVIRRDAYGW
jgi:hypothetical protein